MNYTPNDLQNISFKKAIMGGFSEDAVNEVMDKIIEDYNQLLHENIELKDKVAMLNEGIRHYKNIEESLQNTLIIAQQASEEMKKNACDKADNIKKEAEIEALKRIDEANQEVLKIRFEFEETKKRLHIYKAKSENLLMSQLEMLKQVMEEAR